MRGTISLNRCQIFFKRKEGVSEFDRNVFITQKVNTT